MNPDHQYAECFNPTHITNCNGSSPECKLSAVEVEAEPSKLTEPVNAFKIREILADFMESLEEWQSEIEGSPRKEDFASLDAIYDETIGQLDKEYFKMTNTNKKAPLSPKTTRGGSDTTIPPNTTIDSILLEFYRTARDDEVIPYSAETKDTAKQALEQLIAREVLEAFDEGYEAGEKATPPPLIDAVEFRREQYGWSRNKMAAMLDLSLPHYSEFVHGKRNLPINSVRKAYAIGIPAKVLLAELQSKKEQL